MSNSHGILGFFAGAVLGVAAGVAAGVLMAPRAGAETRDMVAEGAGAAWDNIVDTYQKGAQDAIGRAEEKVSDLGVKSDELREKVEQARARMEQMRSDIAEQAASYQASANQDAGAACDGGAGAGAAAAADGGAKA